MNREETVKILSVLRAAYPTFYRGMSKGELERIVTLWQTMFEADTYSIVSAAVSAHISTDEKGYPPHIGAIKNAIVKLTTPQEMSEMEAWGYVAEALRNSGYHSAEEFEKLPEAVQRIVGSPNQLREWATMDVGEVQSVVQSNFMRSYKARAVSDREFRCLPPSVQSIASELAGRMSLVQLEEPTNYELPLHDPGDPSE